MKRLLIVGLLATLLPLLPVVPTSVAHAASCGKYGWTKSTFLNSLGTTYSEVKVQASWSTSGPSSCWGSGLWGGTWISSASYCYKNLIAALSWLSIDSCTHSRSDTYWYTDSAGHKRYLDITWTQKGNYSFSGAAGNMGSYVENAKFKIRYDGTATKSCPWSGDLPVQTTIHCTYGMGAADN